MTTKPKQIIYPLRYLRSLTAGSEHSDAKFEGAFAALLGGGISVIPLGRARAGIYVLAKLAVTESKRRVVMSSYTIPDVVNMVRFAGGEPVFVDCLDQSTNIDLGHLAELVDSATACVFITHYHVTQNQTAEIVALCRQRGVLCFDDCALVVGAEIGKQPIGAVTDASVFSLSSFKALNFFWGGAITTRSGALAEAADRMVAGWPRLRAAQYRSQILKTLKYDLATRPGIFSRVVFPIYRRKIWSSEVQDVLPLSRVESISLDATITSRPLPGALEEWSRKIDALGGFLRHRRRIAELYDRHLRHRAVSGETIAEIRAGSCHVNYPISIGAARRNDVYRDILSRGYDIGLSLYPNVHETPGFTEIPGRSHKVSTLVRSTVTLPTHPRISEAYAERLAETVKMVLQSHGLD